MISDIKKCKKCHLCITQLPLLDRLGKNQIMVVGLSAKRSTVKDEVPLDNHTRSGKVIYDMEKIAEPYGYGIYRTNLVKCVPLDKNNKIRYPTQAEITQCISHIVTEIEEIHPIAIVLLGKMVQQAFERQYSVQLCDNDGCAFQVHSAGGLNLVPAYHPSYVLRSRERKNKYLENFKEMLNSLGNMGNI